MGRESGKIKLKWKWVLKEIGFDGWTGFIWLGTGDGLLRTR
jgi:hypothetical protein